MIQSVKLEYLSLSKDNVRKTNREASIDVLAASIAAQGLLQNLIARCRLSAPGNRRFAFGRLR